MAVLRRQRVAEWPSAYVERKPVSARVSPFRPTAQEKAILQAVLYASVFDYPLTAEELWRTVPRQAVSIDVLKAALAERPFLRDRIELIEGFYVPAGRGDLIERRRQREGSSRAFLARHRRTLDMVCALPFTRLVAISGSLAHLNADADADLDLFIVTKGPRVWTVAMSLVVLSRLMRRRKAVCANFLLADSHLSLDQHDLYTASQVLHLRPVIGRDMLGRFTEANPFVHDWFPNAKAAKPPQFPLPAAGWPRRLKRPLEALLWIPSGLTETLCRLAYGWHLRRRVSRWQSPDQVRLESGYLKLHTHSHRKAVLEELERLVADSTSHPAGVCSGSS
jgi:hypothetical protein